MFQQLLPWRKISICHFLVLQSYMEVVFSRVVKKLSVLPRCQQLLSSKEGSYTHLRATF